nr:hypothetical protein [Asgard group archaeon]
MTEAQLLQNKNSIKFYDIDKLYFPKICLVCGNKTENTIRKSIIGKFTEIKNRRKDYHLNVPVCNECIKYSQIKKNKESMKIIIPSIIGLILSLVLYFLTLSILIGIAIVSFSTIVPFLLYRAKMSKKIEINKYIKLSSKSIDANSLEDILELEFLNRNYAKYLSELNLEQNTNLTKVEGFKPKHIQGATNSITCHNCKASVPADKKFCINCGTKLELGNQKEQIKNIDLSSNPKFKQEPVVKSNQEIATNIIKSQDSISGNLNQTQEVNDFNLELTCPHCNASNPSNSSFCVLCGKSIIESKKPSFNIDHT